MLWYRLLAASCALLVMYVSGCSCSSSTLGEPCLDDRDCTSPELCDRVSLICVLPGVDAGTADGAISSDGSTGTDSATPECAAPADCDALHGAPPCGAWECNASLCEVVCPGCTDADHDGYGPEPECAGPDCDDADDALGDNGVRSCYGGPAGTAGVGTCVAGTESCVDGLLGACTGAVTPSGEACNGQDEDCDTRTDEDLGTISCGVGACRVTQPSCTDVPTPGTLAVCMPGTPAADDMTCDGIDSDCDGAVDEDCTDCVRVSGSVGDDDDARGDDNLTPFAHIQAAIDWAAADATRPRVVCVGMGTDCDDTLAYDEPVVMSDGVNVIGRYTWIASSTGFVFNQCSGGTGQTIIRPGVDVGVRFPNTVSSPTALDNFDIEREDTPTTSAVTVDGATQVTLSRLYIMTTPSVMRSYGVNLINGAEATITQVAIFGGVASVESIGVRSVGSTPTIVNNCRRLDSGLRCDEFCSDGRFFAIRGAFSTTTGDAFGVLLDDSPGARIEQNAICGNDADVGAGVRIQGDATGTVIRGNLINAWGGEDSSHGVWMTDCGGAAPWLVDNFLIAAAGDTDLTEVDGVRAIGDCHPVVDANVEITGGSEGGSVGANGVHCGVDRATGVASQCVVLGNTLIQGSETGFPPTSVGVRCDNGGCLRIADNVIDARGGVNTWGVYLEATGTVVDDNIIRGGCASNTSIGVYAEGTHARLTNNQIFGGGCNAAGLAPPVHHGVSVLSAGGINEIDVHSNTIDGDGRGVCTSTALLVSSRAVGGAARGSGVFRNNILRAGNCNTRYGVREANTSADPRVFQANNLDPLGLVAPTAVYRDEDTTNLTDAAMVNALTDMTVGRNLSVDSMFASYPTDLHLALGSMCIDAGTTMGAPIDDMDDMRRGLMPDIGADER